METVARVGDSEDTVVNLENAGSATVLADVALLVESFGVSVSAVFDALLVDDGEVKADIVIALSILVSVAEDVVKERAAADVVAAVDCDCEGEDDSEGEDDEEEDDDDEDEEDTVSSFGPVTSMLGNDDLRNNGTAACVMTAEANLPRNVGLETRPTDDATLKAAAPRFFTSSLSRELIAQRSTSDCCFVISKGLRLWAISSATCFRSA